MTETKMTLAVFGAAGKTGRALVDLAARRGHQVRAIEPEWPSDPGLPSGAMAVTGDLLGDGIDAAIDGADAILSTIGVGLSARTVVNPPPLYTEGTKNLLSAMERTRVPRIIVISASFVATRDRGPAWFQAAAGLALDAVFTQMGEMEHILRASDADWTAVRPGWLLDAPLTEDYEVTPDVIGEDRIRTRHADLAHFMLHCAETGTWSRATPAIARAEPGEAGSPDRIVGEVMG